MANTQPDILRHPHIEALRAERIRGLMPHIGAQLGVDSVSLPCLMLRKLISELEDKVGTPMALNITDLITSPHQKDAEFRGITYPVASIQASFLSLAQKIGKLSDVPFTATADANQVTVTLTMPPEDWRPSEASLRVHRDRYITNSTAHLRALQRERRAQLGPYL